MIGLEEQIVAVLRERAEGDVDVVALVEGAGGRGRSRVRRVQGMRVAGAAAVVLAVAGALAMGPASGRGLLDLGRRNGTEGVPRPPLAVGVESAVGHPEVVGADRGLFHRDLEGISRTFSRVRWESSQGSEDLALQSPDGSSVVVVLSPDPANLEPLQASQHATTVGGRPATAAMHRSDSDHTSQVRWQPENGLWAEVTGARDEAAALSVAKAVRIDRVYRCAVPFRLGTVPSGTEVKACELFLYSNGAFQAVGATVGTSSWSLEVSVFAGGAPPPTTTLAGRPAYVQEITDSAGHPPILSVGLDLGDHTVMAQTGNAYDTQAILAAMAGYREVARYDDPGAWSGLPLG